MHVMDTSTHGLAIGVVYGPGHHARGVSYMTRFPRGHGQPFMFMCLHEDGDHCCQCPIPMVC